MDALVRAEADRFRSNSSSTRIFRAAASVASPGSRPGLLGITSSHYAAHVAPSYASIEHCYRVLLRHRSFNSESSDLPWVTSILSDSSTS